MFAVLIFSFLLIGFEESLHAAVKNQCARTLSEFKSKYADGYMDGLDSKLADKIQSLNFSKIEISELLGAEHSVEEILKNREPLNEAIEIFLAENAKSIDDLDIKIDDVTKQIDKANKLKHYKKAKDLEKQLAEIQWTQDQVSENSNYLIALRARIHSISGETLSTSH